MSLLFPKRILKVAKLEGLVLWARPSWPAARHFYKHEKKFSVKLFKWQPYLKRQCQTSPVRTGDAHLQRGTAQ